MLQHLADWAPAAVPFVVFGLLLFVPGSLVLWVGGVSARTSIVMAPIASTAIVGAGAVALSAVGIGWSLGSFGALTLLAAALLAAVRWSIQRRRFRMPALRGLVRRGPLPWVVGGLLVNAAVVAWLYVRPSGGAERFVYEYDTVWHYAVIHRILDTGDASSVNVGLLDGTVGSHFYPAAWHALVALTAQVSGASAAASVQGSVLVTILVTWPVGLVWLYRSLFGPSRQGAFAVSAVAFLSAAYPIGFLTFGLLYPNLFSYSLVPAVLGVAIVALRRFGCDGWAAVRGHVLPVVCVLGAVPVAFVFAQPNSLFTILVILLPLLYVTIWRWLSPERRPTAPRWLRPAAVAAFSAVLAVGWVVVHDSSFLRRTVSVDVWRPFQSTPRAIASWTFYEMYASWQFALGALTLIGLALVLVARRQVWWVVSWVLLGALFVVATSQSGGPGSWRNYLVGFWYADATRIAAAGVIVGLPVVAFALAEGPPRMLALARRRVGPAAARLTPAVTVVLVAVLAVVTALGPAMQQREAKLREQSSVGSEQWVSPEEREFLAAVAGIVPAGVVVANDPFDGSAMAYPLDDVDVLFPALPGNWMGVESDDQRIVAERLKTIQTDPEVCRAVETLDVGYVLVLERGARGVFADVPAMFSGTRVTDATPGFTLVRRDGGLALFRVEPCAGG